MTLDEALAELPLIAILRGVVPEEACDVAEALYRAGFRAVEVPLNSPRPHASIGRLAARFGDRMLVGAGTVIGQDAVAKAAEAGARLVVAPNFDPWVVGAARERGLAAVPGVATPSEAFAALAAGADVLKLFPAEMIGPAVVRALRAVLPKAAKLVPVGGIDTANMGAYRTAGADAFGIGSALFKPGLSVEEVARRAALFVRAAAPHPAGG